MAMALLNLQMENIAEDPNPFTAIPKCQSEVIGKYVHHVEDKLE